MKTISILLSAILFFTACSKSSVAPSGVNNPPPVRTGTITQDSTGNQTQTNNVDSMFVLSTPDVNGLDTITEGNMMAVGFKINGALPISYSFRTMYDLNPQDTNTFHWSTPYPVDSLISPANAYPYYSCLYANSSFALEGNNQPEILVAKLGVNGIPTEVSVRAYYTNEDYITLSIRLR